MCLFSFIYFLMWVGGGGDGENNLMAKKIKGGRSGGMEEVECPIEA